MANGQYNGGVTTQSEAGFQDFVKEYVLRDSFSATVSNVKEMLQDVMGAGNYSQEGTVEWYDAARKMLQGENNWMDGEELYRQITVSPDERFDYLQVYINQAMDVHPPLYYFIVHTVFGIFAGSYLDAYLFGINLFFLLGTCVVLYRMAEELWNRPGLYRKGPVCVGCGSSAWIYDSLLLYFVFTAVVPDCLCENVESTSDCCMSEVSWIDGSCGDCQCNIVALFTLSHSLWISGNRSDFKFEYDGSLGKAATVCGNDPDSDVSG